MRDADPGKRSWGKYSLLVKLNLAIGASFLLTMVLFVFLSYRAYRQFQVEHTVLLLRATLDMVTAAIHEEENSSASAIRDLEAQLNESDTHHNALVLLGPMVQIRQEAREQAEMVKGAPYNLPVRRLDDVRAARQLDLRWTPATADD